ncbi:hypothetical protein GCM10009716_40120 [Streptomyces sodiiphilus]|uniref:Uncharacterized protein n=1 Tax=Streptomyces sodiiphilus TaxID=226217 RepID=A0ABN2PPP1_9ACTN
MISPVDLALARMSVARRPYTGRELDAAEARLAARIPGLMRGGPVAPPGAGEGPVRRGGGTPVAWMRRAGKDLTTLCRTVVEQDGALHHMAAFLGRRVPEPDGARVLGCVLQLAGREDGARFWWQFAAGAGDGPAAYCLHLHHLSLGEVGEAALWHQERDRDGGPGLVLRVLAGLRGERRPCLTAAAEAVVHYVPGAVQYVDEIELPLPEADFAERIEELAAGR